MKDFDLAYIFCKCSARMSRKGKAIRVYEKTPMKHRCPNCGENRKLKKLIKKVA